MNQPTNTLGDLRREIDQIDDAVHDLIMRRTAVVERIRDLKGAGMRLRPAREAEVLRRLAARHRGAFPIRALVQIWREIFGAMVGLQQPFSVAVPVPGPVDLGPLARDEYGVATPILRLEGARAVVAAVGDGRAEIGVVPLPRAAEPEPWWPMLATPAAARVNPVARIPFADAAAEGLTVACLDQAPSGRDRSYLLYAGDGAPSHQAFADAGLPVSATVSDGPGPDVRTLVEIDSYVAPDDGRLASLAIGDGYRLLRTAGGYAVPLSAPAGEKG